MSRILVATNNSGKLLEFRQLLGDGIEVVGLDELGLASPVEDGDTFEANAELKARAAASTSGLLTVADDSGLEVKALSGAPGLYSARFAGIGASDEANRALLLDRMLDFNEDQRAARFVSVISVCTAGGHCRSFRGEWKGRIAWVTRGEGGFGYDSLFELSDGRTVAQLPQDEKNRLSHRAQALGKALPYLRSLINRY